MKVMLKEHFAGGLPGEVLDLPEEQASLLIEKHFAEPAKDEAPESPTESVETVMVTKTSKSKAAK